MMKYLKSLLLVAVIIMSLSSCSPQLTPFTQNLQEKNDWTESELKQIQFYTSKDIVIYRNLERAESELIGGKIKMVNGQRIEQIIIPRNTPGLLTRVGKGNRFAVSFDDNDSASLLFGPNPRYGENYVLLAKNWDNRIGEIEYNGEIFYTTPESINALLMVDLKQRNERELERTTLSGRMLN